MRMVIGYCRGHDPLLFDCGRYLYYQVKLWVSVALEDRIRATQTNLEE